MGLSNSTQDVTSTAAVIGTPSGSRAFLSVRNPTGSGASIYIGGSNITSDNATVTLAAGDDAWSPPPCDCGNSAALEWYALTASGTASDVCICEGS